MFNFSRALRACTVVVALFFASSVSAVTYFNAESGHIVPFGSPDTTSYGEVFKIGASSVLTDWTYWANSGNAGNLKLVVASWDGSKAVGPALYSSSLFAYGGGASALSFTGINAALAAGSYISYITVAGVSSAASGLYMKGSWDNGGLGGDFRFLNSSGIDPLTLDTPWMGNWTPSNLKFSANIVSAVPEPETYAMLLVGLGLIGFMARRRENSFPA